MEEKKVLVALSGGVDSSMAAILLKEQGYDLVGVTFKVFDSGSLRKNPLDRGIRDAKILAKKINIPYYVINLADEFKEEIIRYFVNEYVGGKTPNPCALCNYQIKWTKLIEIADELGCDFVATGHYAEIGYEANRYFISEADDSLKDQTSFLWRLSQDFLKRTLFPLGSLNKKEVKKLAEGEGFNYLAKKQESYSICFIPGGDYRGFLSAKLPKEKGEIIYTDGTLAGYHHGIWNYTLGQKKDLGFENGTNYCVTEIDAKNNRLIIGRQEQLLKQEVKMEQVVFQKYEKIKKAMELNARIKYRGELLSCHIEPLGTKQLKLRFKKPLDSLVPGQSIVLFENQDLVAGGVIV